MCPYVFGVMVYWCDTCLERIALLDKGNLYKVVAYFHGFLYSMPTVKPSVDCQFYQYGIL